jgi:hypothetical protein
MSKRACAVLATFLAAAAAVVVGFLLIGSAPNAAIGLLIGGVVLFVAGVIGIGFLSPMPTDEEMKPNGKRGSSGPSSLDAGIFDAFR